MHVPVGHDQLQHLELTNEIARWFNNRYGETFPAVKPILTEAARVMSLKDPTKKMSKSLGGDHCLFLDDAPAEIERKLRSAVTATGATADPEMPAGVATLFSIFEAFGTVKEVSRFRAQYEAGTIKYSDLKPAVANVFASFFATFRTQKEKLLANRDQLAADLAARARFAADVGPKTTLEHVRKVVGIR